MTLVPDSYESDYQRKHTLTEQAKLDSARPAIETPHFIGMGSNGLPVSWGTARHIADSCADEAVTEILEASELATWHFRALGTVRVVDNKCYAPSEVSA